MSLNPWKPQRVSNLRERITFTGPGEIIGYNEFAEPIFSDPVEITVAARVEPLKGDEVVAAGALQAYHDITFHVRHMEDVSPTWAIAWRGQTFNIKAVRNTDERRRFLSIEATGAA